MYLLHFEIISQTSASAEANLNLSILSSYSLASATAEVASSASKEPGFCSLGSVPPKYLSTIEVVLETKFPRSFARSKLILFIRDLLLYMPSWPKENSLKRKYLSASGL